MQQSDAPLNNDLRTGWQILGELKVPAGSDADGAIHAWLFDLLAPLDLHEDFMNKVLRSAQASTKHVLQPDIEITLGHIHLSILAPHERASTGKTWGFFRIEKIDMKDLDKDHPDHTVEVYLYLEG